MPDDDAKKWVTIKVPKTVRDDAREDPRTYGEIMRDGMDGGESDAILTEEFREKFDGVNLTGELRAQLDRIEAAATTAEERTGRIENTQEELQR
jgi:hypothetical protein